jgi:hypothetical protein
LATNSDISSINDESTTIVAVAPKEAAESVATAHERDMVQFREMVSDKRYETKPSIAPADDIVKQMNQKVDEQSHASLVSTPFVQSKRPMAKKTSTTAASFFANQQTTSKETSKKSKTTSTNSKNVKTISKKPTPPPTKESVPTPPTEKENVVGDTQKMAIDPATVGNADDFVADEEESDDEVEIVAAAKKTKKKQPARAAPSPPPSPEKAASPVRGAMDAFCSEQPSQQTKETDPTRQRKRRKRLVEKTFMENGYLRTETQVLWEDVPTDEEDAQAAKSAPIATKKKPASNIKSTKGQPMKQMGMMGFFAKK